MRKTWNLTNELTSCHSGKTCNILEIKDIPTVEAEFYLETTDKSLSLQTQSIDIVLNLKKIDDKKATGLDKIPSKLLKMAASIIAPSFTNIFSKPILTLIYPSEWKRVTPVFKKGIKLDPNNYTPLSVIPIISKNCLEPTLPLSK